MIAAESGSDIPKTRLALTGSYTPESSLITGLDPQKHYLIEARGEGVELQMGSSRAYLRETVLPVRRGANREALLLETSERKTKEYGRVSLFTCFTE